MAEFSIFLDPLSNIRKLAPTSMDPVAIQDSNTLLKEEPLCPVFGICGGCSHQNVPYETELEIKEAHLRKLLKTQLGLEELLIEPIISSPKFYHYRHRLDIAMYRSKGEVLMGFQSPASRRIVPIDACPIAMENISSFIPTLREQALQKLPADYRTANLVVRTGDDGRIFWGGIGQRSLQLKESDYLWTEIAGRRIYYSLDTFFQANLSILPKIISKLRELAGLGPETVFLDLYSGVGLFGLCLSDQAGKVLMIEDAPASVKLAQFNIAYHQLKHVEVRLARVEEELPKLDLSGFKKTVAMIDPPRQGLSTPVAGTLSSMRQLDSLFYLSCHPESLARDLRVFIQRGWKIEKIVPFDFFPRTQHLETLVLLKP
jgi:23S rRNA (uracil1939-C5)-methyltransferase